jgi:hypothetical protein
VREIILIGGDKEEVVFEVDRSVGRNTAPKGCTWIEKGY